ncbi:two-component system activity regulator YycH [Gracilibacillus sp. YIM 98692]|uniref:YycH family regulatory protein n=1 Tax=Gracilibacillus sp. YIM 98692 TaxID=2663532 RepID=UPI0013D7FCF6|nr:two-component system activity regulator YycH [Gracilibacillus sp. YIM 98692]
MRVEFLKSILLTFLVALSLILTLAIWNYQGEYDIAGDGQPIDAQLNGVEQTKRDLIKPSQFIFHVNQGLLGLEDKQMERQFFQDMMQWSLYDFEMAPEQETFDLSNSTDVVEVTFPTVLPTSYISEMFSIDDTLVYDSYFKRILIYLSDDRMGDHIVFESGDQNGINVQANIQNMPEVREYFERKLMSEDFQPFLTVNLQNNKQVYIPRDIHIEGRKFRFKSISPDSNALQSILFRNPSAIINSPNPDGGQIYTDGNREMIVDGYSMEYTNFSAKESQGEQQENMLSNNGEYLISQSIGYINSHNGWLVDEGVQYQLYRLNEPNNHVEYRMSYDNFPVFSNTGIDTINITLHGQNVYHYNRSLLELTYSYDRAEMELMDGDELLHYLEQSETYSLDQIFNIKLGYRIEQQPGGQIFDLIPTWCIETYFGWEFITGASSLNQGGF